LEIAVAISALRFFFVFTLSYCLLAIKAWALLIDQVDRQAAN